MDARTFDRLTAKAARGPTRRSLLRLLAGSLVTGLLAPRGATPARAAQRPDRDGDGLYDDDEVEVYGTNPDVFDTDGDGVGDGEEIYNRDNGLGGPSDPLTPDGGNAGCPAGQASCGGVCIDVTADPANCGGCGIVCPAGQASCVSGVCLAPAPSSELKCAAQGLSACGGLCTNTFSDSANCGACGNSCPLGGYCEGGACVGGCQGTICGGVCVDTRFDGNNCGACGNVCNMALTCCGRCVNLNTDVNNCGACGAYCFIPIIGDPTCESGLCNP